VEPDEIPARLILIDTQSWGVLKDATTGWEHESQDRDLVEGRAAMDFFYSILSRINCKG